MAYKGKQAIMSVSPSNFTEFYRDLTQQVSNRDFEVSGNFYDIEAQIGLSEKYETVSIRFDKGISKSNLQTNLYNSDDFKRIVFKDIGYRARVGQYFKFGDSAREYFWICIETHNTKTNVSSAIIQKCKERVYFLDNDRNVITQYCVFKDSTQYGIGQSKLEDFTASSSMGNILVQVNDNTLNIHQDQRLYLDRRHFKVVKIDGENSLYSGYGVKEGTLRVVMQENYKDFNADDELMADRYKYFRRPNIKVYYEKVLSYNIGEEFALPVKITKDGLPYTVARTEYNMNECPTLERNGDLFKITGYGRNVLRVTYEEDNFTDIATIDIVCLDDTSTTDIQYYVENKDLMNDDYILRKYVAKTYICKKFIDNQIVGAVYTISYDTSNVTDLSKLKIDDSVENQITIRNTGGNLGSVEIIFLETKTGKEIKQVIQLTK